MTFEIPTPCWKEQPRPISMSASSPMIVDSMVDGLGIRVAMAAAAEIVANPARRYTGA